MRKPPRPVVLALIALLAGGALGALPLAGARAAEAPAGASAFEAIGGCFAAQKHVLLALVMDESASLGDSVAQRPGTDPTARRVAAAQVAVDGIANLASEGTAVDVLLTGFSDDLHVYGGWQPLDLHSRATIERQIEGFRHRDQGLDTDFYNAVVGVQQQLARRAAAVGTGSQPCELVLLFTDGRFDIDTKTPKPYDANGSDPNSVKAAKGIAALCAANGPMQRLRDDGARTITLALSDPSAGAGAADPAFLERLATGECSTAGDQAGASFDVTNAPDLVGQFDAIATRLRGATELAGDCATARSVQVVPALRGFHVFADVGSPPADVVITPPRGSPVRISAATGRTSAVPGVALHATATGDRFVIVEAAPSPGATSDSGGWSGRWSVQFAPPSPGARCRISVFETWKPTVRKVTLQRGVPATLIFDFVDENGRPTPPGALPRGARVTATLSDPAGSTGPVRLVVARAGTRFESKYTPPESFRGQSAVVTATLHLALAGTDVASSPGATELAVRQSGFPSIAQPTLRLTSVTGRGTARAAIDVVGDAAYAGVVCTDGVDYPTPPPVPVARLAATPPQTCVNVAPRGHATLLFTVGVESPGDGRVTGRLHLVMTGVGRKQFDSTLPFTFSIARAVSTTTRNALFFVLLLIGVALPLAFLALLGYRSAVFGLPPGLRAARVRVRVYADGSLRRLGIAGMSPPLAFDEADFADAGIAPRTVRSFTWHDLAFAARSSWNPFATPYGEVRVDQHYVTASEGVLRGSRRGETSGRVSLALPGTWVFALDPASDVVDEQMRAVDGTVTVFIAAGAPFAAQAPRVMRSLTDFFAALARRIDTPTEALVSTGP